MTLSKLSQVVCGDILAVSDSIYSERKCEFEPVMHLFLLLLTILTSQIKWDDVCPRIPDYISDFMLGNSLPMLARCKHITFNVCGNILDLFFC